jgi:predicted DNA-binding mobile mystery protein A
MSGAQLARRADVTRSRISQAESAELDGSMSLKQLSRLAESMECKLVYAIVPKTSVDEILEERAKERAFKIVRNASVHMSLESQALPKTMLTLEIERLKQEMLSSPDHNLWND